MGDYQRFGYKQEPETCLWCGRKLRRKQVMCNEGDPGAVRRGGDDVAGWWVKPADKLGSYQDDSFCGLRCGYLFGLRMAELGKRLGLSMAGTPLG